ncbi:MAG: spore germination protein [Bacillota bacterium]|nr:spore germination protein [Bacillota bacterium]
MRERLHDSSDLLIHEFLLGGRPDWKVAVVYLESLADEAAVKAAVTEPLLLWARPDFVKDLSRASLLDQAHSRLILAQDIKRLETMGDVLDKVLKGHAVLLVDGVEAALAVETKGWPSRAIEKPSSEIGVMGPQVAFTETIKINVALVRLQLNTSDLVIEPMTVGRKSRTDVRLLYVDGVAPGEIVDEVRRRLQSIDTDVILDMGMIRNLIRDDPFSPFAMDRLTERPDSVAAELNKGRVAVLSNNSPFALIMPTNFSMVFDTAEDQYMNPLTSSAMRIIRMFAYALSLFASPVYVAIVTFHYELVPLPLLLNIATTQEGVPLPLGLTAVITELIMEVVREAGVRLPQQFGSAVSIVGALVLGQAAIQAGFVPPGLVIVVTMATIASFAVPRAEKAISYRLLRFPLLLLASTVGFYGVAFGALMMIYQFSSLKSVGVPYFTLYTPGEVHRLATKVVAVPPQLSPATRPLGSHDRVRRGRLPKPRDPKASGRGGSRR